MCTSVCTPKRSKRLGPVQRPSGLFATSRLQNDRSPCVEASWNVDKPLNSRRLGARLSASPSLIACFSQICYGRSFTEQLLSFVVALANQGQPVRQAFREAQAEDRGVSAECLLRRQIGTALFDCWRQQLMQPCDEAQALNQDWLDKLVLTYLQQETELQVCLLLPQTFKLSVPTLYTRSLSGWSTLLSKPIERL